MRSDLNRAAGAVMLLAVTLGTGCTEFENRVLQKVPFFSFMHEAPFFDPYEMPLPPPPGSVPFASPAGTVLPPLAARDDSILAFAAGPDGTNPLDATDSAVLEMGRVMYDRHCAVCHGSQGAGDGTLVGPGKFPFAADLTAPAVVARSDGFLYGVIRAGKGLMPSYGPRTTHAERWAIVVYLREVLQAGAQPPPGAVAPAATPATTATQDSAGATTGGEDR